MYLPDTNIFIRAFNGFKVEEKFLHQIISEKQIAISVIVLAEFYAKAGDREKRTFDKLISETKILEIDSEVARLAGEYRKSSLKKIRVQLLDCFLAAQAKINNLTLVTNNRTDFPMKDVKVISP